MDKPYIDTGIETETFTTRKGSSLQRITHQVSSNTLEGNKWDTIVDWTYLGHGEWVPLETGEVHSINTAMDKVAREPEWVYKWRCKMDEDIKIHQEVVEGGYPSRWGARRPVKTKWNLDRFKELLQEYEDREVVEWIRYGWPTGRLPVLPEPAITNSNHKGATDHPEALQKYIKKENEHGAIMGYYDKISFQGKVGVSPLSTRPKRDSAERRVIVDLSFPVGSGVNEGILKDNYLGFSAQLTFPKVDDFAFRIYTLGQGCMMFKVDLSQYFRQLPLNPGDYSLLGYIIDGQIYFDKVLPMGMRSAPYIAQRVTNAIAYIHRQMQFFLLNYVDDFVGAEIKQRIWQAFEALTTLLDELNVDTSSEKMVPPTTRLEFLGITFDSQHMTMEISKQKMSEIIAELNSWLLKTSARRREVELLIGKLQFLAKCIRAGWIFLSRLINWIKGMNRHSNYSITNEARKDIAWWGKCAEQFNGTSLIWLHKEPAPDRVLATDACLKGYGGICGNQYFRGRFPIHLRKSNIALLEILAVMVALKVWWPMLKGCYFWIHVDNEAVAAILNSGASRDEVYRTPCRKLLS